MRRELVLAFELNAWRSAYPALAASWQHRTPRTLKQRVGPNLVPWTETRPSTYVHGS